MATAKPAARPAPSFFSTKWGKLTGALVGVAIAGVIGVLWWMNSSKVDPVLVVAELKEEIEAANRLPLEKVIEKDELIHAILDNERYQKYGGETRKQIDRIHPALHDQAELERKAREKVRPFLARYERLKRDPQGLGREAQRLHDEVKPLRDQFGSTAFGAKLERLDGELRAVLESGGGESWEASYIALKQGSDRAASAGDFASALAAVDEFGARHRQDENAEVARKLAELRESLEKRGDVQVEALLKRARQLPGPEAASLVEPARARFKGVPLAWKLEEALKVR